MNPSTNTKPAFFREIKRAMHKGVRRIRHQQWRKVQISIMSWMISLIWSMRIWSKLRRFTLGEKAFTRKRFSLKITTNFSQSLMMKIRDLTEKTSIMPSKTKDSNKATKGEIKLKIFKDKNDMKWIILSTKTP